MPTSHVCVRRNSAERDAERDAKREEEKRARDAKREEEKRARDAERDARPLDVLGVRASGGVLGKVGVALAEVS